jgi:hypothetical protein
VLMSSFTNALVTLKKSSSEAVSCFVLIFERSSVLCSYAIIETTYIGFTRFHKHLLLGIVSQVVGGSRRFLKLTQRLFD